jgi:hypothetical protein
LEKQHIRSIIQASLAEKIDVIASQKDLQAIDNRQISNCKEKRRVNIKIVDSSEKRHKEEHSITLKTKEVTGSQ